MTEIYILPWHWIPTHFEGTDWQVLQSTLPRIIKVVWEGQSPPYVDSVLQAGAGYLYRAYWMSENFGSRDLISVTEAANIGAAHAAYLQPAHASLLNQGVPANQIWFEGINEPMVWTPQESPARVAAYYAAFLQGLHAFGARGVCGCFGVGWPTNSAPGEPPDWEPFRPMLAAMVTDPDYPDYVGGHEYWGLEGPLQNWLWWGGRMTQLPEEYDVPYLITETGIDLGVIGRDGEGWTSLPGSSLDEKAARYCDEIWAYLNMMAQDPRFQGAMPFTYDCNLNDWATFNLKVAPFITQLYQQISEVGIPSTQRWTGGTPMSYEVSGLDISYWQGTITPEMWQAIANEHDFVIIRASFGTAGTSDPMRPDDIPAGIEDIELEPGAYVDANWETNYARASSVLRPDGTPLGIGGYHYLHGGVGGQAGVFAGAIEGKELSLGPWKDIEDSSITSCDRIASFKDWCIVRGITAPIGVYSRASFFDPLCGCTPSWLEEDQDLWVAHWFATTPTLCCAWDKGTFWQWSNDGVLPGTSNVRVDLNWYMGSREEFRARYNLLPSCPVEQIELRLQGIEAEIAGIRDLIAVPESKGMRVSDAPVVPRGHLSEPNRPKRLFS